MAGILRSGSQVAVGFKLTFTSAVSYDLQGLKDAVEGCLYNTGVVASVDEISSPQTFGFNSDYILIVCTTVGDFGSIEDFASIVRTQLLDCGGVSISTQYPATLVRIPDQYRSDPGSLQPAPNAPTPGAGQPGPCDNKSGFDYLACQTGLEPGAARLGSFALLAVGAIVLIGVLKR